MPDLSIINNLDEAIHVAFSMTAPAFWKNNLAPGERWTVHLPTLPLHFQVRSREFSAKESWEIGATIGAACVAGTASVLTATLASGTAALLWMLLMQVVADTLIWGQMIYFTRQECACLGLTTKNTRSGGSERERCVYSGTSARTSKLE
ncbi:hypothetical protein PAXINDRAFT_101089 [Paxillus involutus ATCC 200175]|uniref:Uncharacterized protein n=1 Tax=Paxillus involutus ATCC 200175 TaxID=664439 RepID=A0A0C9SUI4_PAXIN|nr:hypothetical protein PAXINDRAFT_101089 [Paxillus involutus ATCC 200175]